MLRADKWAPITDGQCGMCCFGLLHAVAMWAVVVCVLLLTSSVLGSCPDKCRCPDTEDDVLIEVHCNNASLTELPIGDLQETFFIDLSLNNITTLKNDAFKERNWLKVGRLYLDRNGLKTIEDHAFRDLTQLKILNLASNHLTKIPADVYEINNQLEALSLNENKNIELPETGFNLPNLDILSLKHCGLKKIPLNFFQNVTNLHLLFLQGNELISFDPQLVSPLTKLSHLDLRDNRFTSLPLDLVRFMSKTLFIRFEGNHFNCTCAMSQVYSLYRSRHFNEQLSCIDPTNISFDDYLKSRCNQTNLKTPPKSVTSLTSPATTTVVTTTLVTTIVTTSNVTTAANVSTTTTPVSVRAWNPWWVIFGVVLALLILIAVVWVVIRRERLGRGYTVHRTFTVLDEDEEQNFIT